MITAQDILITAICVVFAAVLSARSMFFYSELVLAEYETRRIFSKLSQKYGDIEQAIEDIAKNLSCLVSTQKKEK